MCVFVQKQESAGKSWLLVGPRAGLAGEMAVARVPPLRKLPAHHPLLPLWSSGRGLTVDLRAGLSPWWGSK